ncbi:MAG: LemA family protein [Rickettsiales bacterium]|jgi:LemA protein|nr:LemA family protein [Rickettsiales bacterium]
MDAYTYTLAGIAVVALYAIALYNSLAAKKSQVEEAWSTIDTQLKRRYDLIPNLVETVKGYAKHESATLEGVVRARRAGMEGLKARDPEKLSRTEGEIARGLGSIFALGEAYPALKANEGFVELSRELSDTETKIQAARQFYNTCVLSLNTAVVTFPGNLMAGLMNFAKAEYFEIEESEKANPKVRF